MAPGSCVTEILGIWMEITGLLEDYDGNGRSCEVSCFDTYF